MIRTDPTIVVRMNMVKTTSAERTTGSSTALPSIFTALTAFEWSRLLNPFFTYSYTSLSLPILIPPLVELLDAPIMVTTISRITHCDGHTE